MNGSYPAGNSPAGIAPADGCDHEQIKSVTGHVTDSKVIRYVRAANQEKLGDQSDSGDRR